MNLSAELAAMRARVAELEQALRAWQTALGTEWPSGASLHEAVDEARRLTRKALGEKGE